MSPATVDRRGSAFRPLLRAAVKLSSQVGGTTAAAAATGRVTVSDAQSGHAVLIDQ